jgi:hypothetical protein
VELNNNRPELVTALQLKKIEEITKLEIDENQPDLITVNYEDFASNPYREVERLKAHPNLEKDQKIYDFLKQSNVRLKDKNDEAYFSTEVLEEIYSILN